MKVLCDEHVPAALENALRGEGIETVHASDVLEAGTSDDALLEYARTERLVVLTNDSAVAVTGGSVLRRPTDATSGTGPRCPQRLRRDGRGPP